MFVLLGFAGRGSLGDSGEKRACDFSGYSGDLFPDGDSSDHSGHDGISREVGQLSRFLLLFPDLQPLAPMGRLGGSAKIEARTLPPESRGDTQSGANPLRGSLTKAQADVAGGILIKAIGGARQERMLHGQ